MSTTVPARQIAGDTSPAFEVTVPLTLPEAEVRRQLKEAVDAWVTQALTQHQGEVREDVSLTLGGTARKVSKEINEITLDSDAAAHLARIEGMFRENFCLMNARTRRTLVALLARRGIPSTAVELASITGYAASSMHAGVTTLKEFFGRPRVSEGGYVIQGVPSTGWQIILPPLPMAESTAVRLDS